MHLTTQSVKQNILRSTSRLKQIMQQIVLPSFLLWKNYFKNLGYKVHFCGSSAATIALVLHPYSMAILDGSS